MAQDSPAAYVFDAADPRAPSEAQWAAMTPAERGRAVAMLPVEVPWELMPPEGDAHLGAKIRAKSTLEDFYRRAGKRIYVSCELGVFYPAEPRFSPDVLAVLDVEPHARNTWVVQVEGKGLDLVIEVHYEGDRAKDYTTNVERYARLGITEYFIFDARRFDLRGHRLAPLEGRKARAYRPILPQGGRWASEVLGLDLALDGGTLRFFHGNAPLLEASELVEKLGKMLDEVVTHKREAEEREQAASEREQAATERERAASERAAEAEQQLSEARAEIARLKGGEAT